MHPQTGTISVTTSLSPNCCLLVRRAAREDCWRHSGPPESPGQSSRGRLGRVGGHQSAHGRCPKAGAARASGRAHNGRAYSRGAEQNRPRPPPVFPAPRGRFGGGWRGARPWGARVAILASERARPRTPWLSSGCGAAPSQVSVPRARSPPRPPPPPARVGGAAGGRGRAGPRLGRGARGASVWGTRGGLAGVAHCVSVCESECVRASV